MNRHAAGRRIPNANETKTGRMTVTALNAGEDPRVEITCTIIRPTTSSIMAAEVSTTPKREEVRLLLLRRVNVVPRLVEQRAAPAANAWRGEAPTRGERMKERPIGAAIPVVATKMERSRLAFRAEKDVDKPPMYSYQVSRSQVIVTAIVSI